VEQTDSAAIRRVPETAARMRPSYITTLRLAEPACSGEEHVVFVRRGPSCSTSKRSGPLKQSIDLLRHKRGAISEVMTEIVSTN
jgi:hypothetical protein